MITKWIKKGIEKEFKAIKKVETIYLTLALIGIPSLLNLFISINLQVIGIIYFIFGVTIFILSHKPKKKEVKFK